MRSAQGCARRGDALIVFECVPPPFVCVDHEPCQMRTVASWKEAANAAKLDEVEATEMTSARVAPAVVAAFAAAVGAMGSLGGAAVKAGVVVGSPPTRRVG